MRSSGFPPLVFSTNPSLQKQCYSRSVCQSALDEDTHRTSFVDGKCISNTSCRTHLQLRRIITDAVCIIAAWFGKLQKRISGNELNTISVFCYLAYIAARRCGEREVETTVFRETHSPNRDRLVLEEERSIGLITTVSSKLSSRCR